MGLLSYFIPRTLVRSSSAYNRDIRVIEEWGNTRLIVNGILQSGPYYKHLWNRALRQFALDQLPQARRILVLGVGGATVIHLLHQYYPRVQVTGVDIDAAIIDIAKRYFGMSPKSGLILVCADAQQYVTSVTTQKKRYDLVIVDLFVGQQQPAFVISKTFLRNLLRLLAPHGQVLVNCSGGPEYAASLGRLRTHLSGIYTRVIEVPIARNRFLLARRN